MSGLQHAGALSRRRVRHFDVGGYVGPVAPGFAVGPYGAPEFAPGGIQGGGAQAPGALGTSMGAGPGPSAGPSLGSGAPGSGIAGLGLTSRDIATTAGSVVLGALGTAVLGPIGGLIGSMGGKYGVGAIYDALNPSAPTSMAPTPTMEPTAEPTAPATPGGLGGQAAVAGVGSGGGGNAAGDATGSLETPSGDKADPDLHARGGRIHRHGALARRLRARK